MSPGVTPFFCNGQIVTIAGFVGHTVQLQLLNSGGCVQFSVLCMGTEIWISHNTHVSQRVNFFPPIIRKYTNHRCHPCWNRQVWPMGRSMLTSEWVCPASEAVEFYPSSCCPHWHCAIIGLCLFLLSILWAGTETFLYSRHPWRIVGACWTLSKWMVWSLSYFQDNGVYGKPWEVIVSFLQWNICLDSSILKCI